MIGDIGDFVGRLKAVLPARWFGDTTPVLDGLLSGLAAAWSGLYGLLQGVAAQARIATASGIFLDMASADYFGGALPRAAGESDAAFSLRIYANLLAPRATRASVVAALTNLTGRAPVIFEPLNAADTGGYNSGWLGYGVAGGYGCAALPFQFFVTGYRPNAAPVSHAGGYGIGPGGYNTAPMFYANLENVGGAVTDSALYAAVASVLPTASIAWMNLSN